MIRGKSQSDIRLFGNRGAGTDKPIVLAPGDKDDATSYVHMRFFLSDALSQAGNSLGAGRRGR
jgi:hypothetical protein